MKKGIPSLLVKFLKYTSISIASILLLLFLAPILFPGTIAEKVKVFTNKNLDAELNFSKVRLSFFNHFPSLTVTLYDFSLKGSAPFKKDTLVAASEVALGINIKNLIFDNEINIDKIFVSNALMNVQVNEKGEANYNVYVSEKKESTSNTKDSSSASLRLEKIDIKNSHLVYNDKSVGILIDAKGLDYIGKGDLSKAVFDLYSHAKIDSIDFYFDNEPYLKNKKVDADLITKINTNSLAFFFEKNNLVINQLPVQFSGKLDFLSNGYDLDFKLNSTKSELYDFITALPPQYLTWLEKTTINGTTDIVLSLKGQYIASTNTMPDLAFNMSIRDGYIAYEDAPFPVSNLFLNFDTKLPAINTDSLQVKVDSIFFNVNKDYFSAIINTKGLTNPHVFAKVKTAMDLENLDKAFGFSSIDLKGKCDVNLIVDGQYKTGPNPNSIRHEDILLSIPSFNLQSSVKDGYFKYTILPQAVSNINLKLNSACKGNDYKDIGFSMSDFSAIALNNFIKGYVAVNSLEDMDVDANLQSAINLAEIKNIYPIDGLDLLGLLKLNITAKGKYDEVKGIFPVMTADVVLQNGVIKTSYYPNPINNINVVLKAQDATGTLKGLNVDVQPASFQFEDNPFTIQASFKNFDDIAYNIKANGQIDVAKIYKVFSQKGLAITGLIKANLSLQGKQSDATSGRYGLLNNEGTLEINDLTTHTEYLPQPFLIKYGLFKFKQDRMLFNNFSAAYGQSDFKMNGYLQNVINYVLSDKEILKGNFNLISNFINIDEFMAYAPASTDSASVTVSETGVIIVPNNLNVSFAAAAKKVGYNELLLENVSGGLLINKGKIDLKKAGFNLIGCDVVMDATYGNITPSKAFFDYHIVAKEFDVKRAYNEIKLFRDMATAASKAQGIISLDYKLTGKLDSNMYPIYPSLVGGGVLSIKKVKVNGLKLFTVASKKTGRSAINNPDLSKVDIKTTIKNNIITIERFKMRIAGFRPRIEGTTSFDGRLNLKMRLGLPPLGIIGIPLRITGTQENPTIKLGKRDTEAIPETEYVEDDEEIAEPTL